jgi:hypothetical protein
LKQQLGRFPVAEGALVSGLSRHGGIYTALAIFPDPQLKSLEREEINPSIPIGPNVPLAGSP